MMRMGKHIHRLDSCNPVVFRHQRISLACVAGLQLMYTILAGAALIIVFTTSSCIPARGGSVIITSGCPVLIYKLTFRKYILHVACKKFSISILFISELIHGVLHCIFNIFNSNHFWCITGNKVCNSACTCIEIIYNFIPCNPANSLLSCIVSEPALYWSDRNDFGPILNFRPSISSIKMIISFIKNRFLIA